MSLIHPQKECEVTKSVLLYGNDKGAMTVLQAVEQAAQATEFGELNLYRIQGDNVPVSEEDWGRLATSDAVIFGISSGMPEALLASWALGKNPALAGKIFFMEDFPGSSGIHSDVLKGIGKQLRLCSILPLPLDAPERDVYGAVHTVGCPDHWVPSMRQIQEGTTARQGATLRKRRRGMEEAVSLSPNELVVYVTGFKDPVMELKALRHLRSLSSMEGPPFLVHFRAHPGERANPKLAEAILERDALLQGDWEIVVPPHVDQKLVEPWMIGVADVTVVFSGSTSQFWGAAARKKMVCPREFELGRTTKTSSYDYALVERSVHVVKRVDELGGAIGALVVKNSPEAAALLAKQEKNAFSFGDDDGVSHGKNVLQLVKDS